MFGSIVASTIWRESNEIRIVWITMLAMADKNGLVGASIPGLADLARVSMEDCLRALKALQEPDPYSRTPDFEGRRIEVVDGGWRILNHSKYRNKMGLDERREYLRVKQQEARDKKKAARQQSSTIVNGRSGKSTVSTHAEAYSQSETKAETKAEAVPTTLPARTQLRWSEQQGWEGVSDELKTRWAEAYPACNVARQLLAMQEWLMANPKKAKKSNWRTFIVNWLTKSQNRGGDERPAPRNGVRPVKDTELKLGHAIPIWEPPNDTDEPLEY